MNIFIVENDIYCYLYKKNNVLKYFPIFWIFLWLLMLIVKWIKKKLDKSSYAAFVARKFNQSKTDKYDSAVVKKTYFRFYSSLHLSILSTLNERHFFRMRTLNNLQLLQTHYAPTCLLWVTRNSCNNSTYDSCICIV